MLIKFLKHGKGSGKAAIDYLLGELDHKNEPRAGVKVLRGDPYLLADLIDSLDNVHRYTSGVIAFHPEDLPSDQDIEDVIDDFENVAFAGLEKNQYTYAVVQHIEADGTKHLHFICPRIDLVSGKSLNVAPPGHEHYFKHWRDAWNEEKGWRSPADIELVRDPGTKELPEWKLTNFKKDVIQKFLVDNMRAGAFKDRQEMINYLSRFGEVTRVGQDYIAFKAKGEAKAVRLKGVMFSEGWKYDSVNIETKKQANPEKAEKHRQKLKPLYEKRAEYNKRKYKKKEAVSEPIQIEQDAIQLITTEENEHEQQATDRYPESVVDAIERAAEVNRIANEVNSEAERKTRFKDERSERRDIKSEQIFGAAERTRAAVAILESRIAESEQAITDSKRRNEQATRRNLEAQQNIAAAEPRIIESKQAIEFTELRAFRAKQVVAKSKQSTELAEPRVAKSAKFIDELRSRIEIFGQSIVKFKELAHSIISKIQQAVKKKNVVFDLEYFKNEARSEFHAMGSSERIDLMVEAVYEKQSKTKREALNEVNSVITSGSEELVQEFNELAIEYDAEIRFEKYRATATVADEKNEGVVQQVLEKNADSADFDFGKR